MRKYVLTRVATSIVMLVATSLLIFIALRLLPGDPVLTKYGATPGITPKAIEQIRHGLGLDRPLVLQYFSWIGGMLHGDFGRSFFSQYSVTSLIASSLPPTLELTLLAMVVAVCLAVPAGVLSAVRPGSLVDRLIGMLASATLACPQFLLGIILLYVFSLRVHWLPARGYVSLSTSVVENLRHMVLPAFTLGLIAGSVILRFLRTSMLESLESSFIRTAEGKGASRARVVIGHALPNALIPSLTMLGLIVGYTLGGVVVIEYVFGFSGLGALALQAVQNRDYAVLQSVALLVGALFILTTLVTDLLYGVVDPRLRIGRGNR